MNSAPALDPSAARAAAVDGASAARAGAVELYAAARPAVAMAGLTSGQLVEFIGECQAGARAFQAAEVLALARLAATEEVVREDGTVEEVSQGLGYRRLDAPDLVSDVLGLSAQAAGARVDDAVVLATKLPSLVDAMGAGRVDAYRAGIIATELREASRAVCDQVLARIDGSLAQPGWVLRRRTRRALEVVDKDSLVARVRRGRSALGLRMVPNEDSTDTWTAVLPTEQSREAWAAVEPLAKQIRDTDGCTLDMARARAMTQLMLGNCTGTFHVHFAVPADQADGFAARFTGQPTNPSTPDEADPEPDVDEDGITPDTFGAAAHAEARQAAERATPTGDWSAAAPTDDSFAGATPDRETRAEEADDFATGGDDANPTGDHALRCDRRDGSVGAPEGEAGYPASGADDTNPTGDHAPDSDLRDDPAAAVADEWAVVTGMGTTGTTIVPAGWLADVLGGHRGSVEADVIGCDPVTGGFVTAPTPLPRPGRVTDRDPDGKLADRRARSMPKLVTKAYRPTRACRAYVTARDQRCRFPGCTASAYFTDLDHVRAWPLGPTAPGNLACLCRRHHRIKQRPGWTARLNPDGSMGWTDPTGQVRTTFPVDHLGTTLPATAATGTQPGEYRNTPVNQSASGTPTGTGTVGFGDAIWDHDYQDPDAYTGGIPLWLAIERDLAERLRHHRTRTTATEAAPLTNVERLWENQLLAQLDEDVQRPLLPIHGRDMHWLDRGPRRCELTSATMAPTDDGQPPF